MAGAEWTGGRAADWRDDALCREIGPADDMWFPERGESNAEARRICRLCPVTGECLDFALDHDIGFGVWGNTSEKQRRRIRRERRERAA